MQCMQILNNYFTIQGSFFFKENTTFLRFICKVPKFFLYLHRVNRKVLWKLLH